MTVENEAVKKGCGAAQVYNGPVRDAKFINLETSKGAYSWKL